MKMIRINSVLPGMIVGHHVVNEYGKILVGRGVKLNNRMIKLMKEHGVFQVSVMEESDLTRSGGTKKENYQLMVQSMVRHELLNLTNIHFHGLFLSVDHATTQYEQIIQILENICINDQLLTVLIMLKGLDPNYIHRYSKVLVLSLMIGIDMGLEEERLEKLAISSLLFNCGHLIQRSLKRRKATPLFEDASQAISSAYEDHSLVGYDFLRKIFDEDIARPALEHHERVSGGGFPNNRSGSELTLISKMIMVCGKFISLQSSNGLRPAIPIDLAFDYIVSGEGHLFDLNVVHSFRKFIHPYPIGSVLEMSDGSRGMVLKHGYAPNYVPFVQVLKCPSKRFEPGDFVFFEETDHCFIKSESFVWL